MTQPPRLNPVVGVDLGGTHVNAAAVFDGHTCGPRRGGKTEAAGGSDQVIANITHAVHQACEAAELKLQDVRGIGIAAAGAIDMDSGVVLSAPNLGWSHFPLRARLTERLERPVLVENDVNGAAWGEYVMLAPAERRPSMLGVWVGTGVGGGLILDGKIFHGDGSTAAELGQTVMDRREPAGWRTVEDLSSRTGLRRRAEAKRVDHPDSMLFSRTAASPGGVSTAEFADAWRAKDALATMLIDDAAHVLGVAIANCITMGSLDDVCIGGGVTEALGEPWIDMIAGHARAHCFPKERQACTIRMTRLAEEAGIIGAAALARDRFT